MTENMRDKKKKIRQVMNTYQKELRDRSSSSSDEIEAPVNNILPTYFEVFKANNDDSNIPKNLPDKFCYDVGIFLVGYSSIPIVLSIAAIQPHQEIYFLHSERTDYIVLEIRERIKAMLGNNSAFKSLIALVNNSIVNNSKCKKIKNPSDPIATFKEIKDIVNTVGDKRIALDLTGGKKPMLGGGFTAGAILRFADSIRSSVCDMFYVDSQSYNEKLGAPVPGTEFLNQLENPYDVYNVQTVQSAKELFSKHNYDAAASLWESVERKLETHAKPYALEAEMEDTKRHRRMANCYYHWDAFYYQRAKGIKNRFDNFGYQEKHVCDSIDVLDILSEVRNRTTLFANKKRVIHYAVDRYQNAIRRMDSGKLDDAIVRFAQVIEMICIYEIKQIATNGGLFTGEGNPVSNAPNDWGFIPLIRFLFEPTAQHERLDGRYYKISDDHHLLIGSYDCETVEEIINLIEFRHDFIHFNNRMNQEETEENARGLKQLARKFLKNAASSYYCDDGLSFDELLDLHKFRW